MLHNDSLRVSVEIRLYNVCDTQNFRFTLRFSSGVGCAVFAFMVLLVAVTVALVCGLVLDVRWLYVGIASAVAVILMVYLAVDVQVTTGINLIAGTALGSLAREVSWLRIDPL